MEMIMFMWIMGVIVSLIGLSVVFAWRIAQQQPPVDDFGVPVLRRPLAVWRAE